MTPTPLNPQQQAAVESGAPNIVVVAAPGTGKTATLVERIRRRLRENPDARIAAVTYTIAAAAELRERIGPGAPGLFVGTIHALALALLRGPWAKHLPCSEPLTVMTADRDKRQLEAAKALVRYKGTQKALDAEFKEGSGRWLDAGGIGAGTPAALVASAYYQACRKASLISYDDLIKVATMVDRDPETRFDELLVDEYQDASAETNRLCCVIPARSRFFIGDPRQSIFGWLGGSPQRMERLDAAAGWTRFDLTQSYRCPAPVAAAANRLLAAASNGLRLPPMLPAHDAGCVRYWDNSFQTADDEMRAVAEDIRQKLGLDGPPRPASSIAVLARTNFLVSQLAEHMAAAGIPVTQSDKNGLPDNWELVLAAAAMVDQPHNDALVYDLAAMVNGPQEAARMRDEAVLADRPLIEIVMPIPPPAAKNAAEAAVALEMFLAVIGGDPRALDLLHLALERVGPEASAGELRLALADPGLRERETRTGAVDVCTIHSYKGREADHVFIVGCNEGILPGRGALDEERRLFYVALTRARISCTLTCARERLLGSWSKQPEACAPSRFVAEAMGGEAAPIQ